jgi:hypothetical protein
MSTKQPELQQSGGVRMIENVMAKFDDPFKILFVVLLVLLGVFNYEVPMNIRCFMNSMLGRIISIIGLFYIIQHTDYVYAIIAGTILLVILYAVPCTYDESDQSGVKEGFYDIASVRSIGGPWFVERVLGFSGQKLRTDRVSTTSVQDDSEVKTFGRR